MLNFQKKNILHFKLFVNKKFILMDYVYEIKLNAFFVNVQI